MMNNWSINSKQLKDYGWKFYEYVENALGLGEEYYGNEYNPNFGTEENSSSSNGIFKSGPKCPDCVYTNDLSSDIAQILHIGYRTCSMCSQIFCLNHCYRKPLSLSSEENNEEIDTQLHNFSSNQPNNFVYICQSCYKKSQIQVLGTTRDKTNLFVERRAKKINFREQKQFVLLHNLEKLSRIPPDSKNYQSYISTLWNTTGINNIVSTTSNAPSSCSQCHTAFSFWAPENKCPLCHTSVCGRCLQYSIPLGKSVLNPNAPARTDDVIICKNCHILFLFKKKRVEFLKSLQTSQDLELVHCYEHLCAIRQQMDQKLQLVQEKSFVLDQSIVEDFDLMKSVVSTGEKIQSPWESSKQELEQALVQSCMDLESCLRQLLQIPCQSKREKTLLENIKRAFVQTRANVVLKNLQE